MPTCFQGGSTRYKAERVPGGLRFVGSRRAHAQPKTECVGPEELSKDQGEESPTDAIGVEVVDQGDCCCLTTTVD